MWNVQNEQKEIEEDNALLYEQWKAAREQFEEQVTENCKLQSVQSSQCCVWKDMCLLNELSSSLLVHHGIIIIVLIIIILIRTSSTVNNKQEKIMHGKHGKSKYELRYISVIQRHQS